MAKTLTRVENLIDDHHSNQDGGKSRLGLMFKHLLPTLVSLGREGYSGILSINEVTLEKDGYHLTTRSMAVLSAKQLEALMQNGELKLSDDWFITLLPNALCNEGPKEEEAVTHGKCANCQRRTPVSELKLKKDFCGFKHAEVCNECTTRIALRNREEAAQQMRIQNSADSVNGDPTGYEW